MNKFYNVELKVIILNGHDLTYHKNENIPIRMDLDDL